MVEILTGCRPLFEHLLFKPNWLLKGNFSFLEQLLLVRRKDASGEDIPAVNRAFVLLTDSNTSRLVSFSFQQIQKTLFDLIYSRRLNFVFQRTKSYLDLSQY